MLNPLPDFSKTSLLVVGDVMLDRYWFGDTTRISPEAPVPVVKVNQIDERPGGAGNVALNLAALGANVTLIGIAGKDNAAQSLQQLLTHAKINVAIDQQDTVPTITKLRAISRHQQLIRLDFEEKFPAFHPEALIQSYKKFLYSSHLVILSDYNKGTLECAATLIRLAKEARIPIIVDPKGADFSRYSGADIITPNVKEFETIMGTCHNEHDISEKGQQFLTQHNIESLLLTRGERGMTLIQKNQEELHLPAHAREVFDVTGAGDTVIATLGASLAAGVALPEAMALANLAAGLVVAKLGTATVSASELAATLAPVPPVLRGIMSEEQLLLAISKAHLQGKKVVFTNGCFDILHAGHVHYLQQAKQLGDFLIVAVNEDESITRLKGPGRPINNTEQRMAVLAGLSAVDWVTSFSDETPERLLRKLQPDILVKGGDYTIDQIVGAPIVYAYGGEVRALGVIKNMSTTSIINRMVQNHQAMENQPA